MASCNLSNWKKIQHADTDKRLFFLTLCNLAVHLLDMPMLSVHLVVLHVYFTMFYVSHYPALHSCQFSTTALLLPGYIGCWTILNLAVTLKILFALC